jgi:diguanylate cyclase
VPNGSTKTDTRFPTTDAFDIAKEALGYVGKFNTPPTPDVYEVWYRFVEGRNEALLEQLSHAVHEAQDVNSSLLSKLHDQFREQNDGTIDQVSLELSHELNELQALVSSQISAGDEFHHSIDSATETITSGIGTSQSVEACLAGLLSSNRKMQSQLKEMETRLLESQMQVDSLRNDLHESQRSVMTDPLTGVGNRRYFDAVMDQALNSKASLNKQTFLILIDLDEFKKINDTFGHSIGDRVLCFVAGETQKIRPDASIARYGGDEFAVFVQSKENGETLRLAEYIHRFFSTNVAAVEHGGQSIGTVKLSLGVARLRVDDTRESWFNRADQLLSRAKASGRNCVMVERILDR